MEVLSACGLGPQVLGGGAAVFSQMPQRACLSCGVETKARTLSCGFRVLPILPLIPCLISGAWKAGKKQAWPSHPPSKHNHIALKNSTQPSPAVPHPTPHLSGTEKPKHAKTHGCYAYYQGENKFPHQTEFPNQDSYHEVAVQPHRWILLSSFSRESFW